MVYLVIVVILFIISIIVAVVNSRRKKEWKAKLAAGDGFRVTVPRDEVIRRFTEAGWMGESRKKFGNNPINNLGSVTPTGILLDWHGLIGNKVMDVTITITEEGIGSTLIWMNYSYQKGNNDTLNRGINEFETEIAFMFRDVMAGVQAS